MHYAGTTYDQYALIIVIGLVSGLDILSVIVSVYNFYHLSIGLYSRWFVG